MFCQVANLCSVWILHIFLSVMKTQVGSVHVPVPTFCISSCCNVTIRKRFNYIQITFTIGRI